MLTSWSEQSTPAELSIASVLILPPARANSMRPRWVSPRLPPSPTTLTRSSLPSTRTASLALSPASACDSVGRLDVGADAAVPQQVGRGAQDGRDQLGRAQLGDVRRRCPSAARISGPTGTDFAVRGHTPPPALISARS